MTSMEAWLASMVVGALGGWFSYTENVAVRMVALSLCVIAGILEGYSLWGAP